MHFNPVMWLALAVIQLTGVMSELQASPSCEPFLPEGHSCARSSCVTALLPADNETGCQARPVGLSICRVPALQNTEAAHDIPQRCCIADSATEIFVDAIQMAGTGGSDSAELQQGS